MWDEEREDRDVQGKAETSVDECEADSAYSFQAEDVHPVFSETLIK